MNLHSIFINKAGRLRSGWRLALYIFALIALSFLIGSVLRVLYAVGSAVVPRLPHAAFYSNIIFRLSELAAALGAGYFCARVLEHLPWRSLGLTLHKGWVRDLLIGSAIGFAALAFAVAIAAVGGGLRFSFIGSQMLPAAGRSLVAFGALLLIAALAEEAMFRGYPLQTFARAGLVSLGVILTSLPFGLAHLFNPNVVPGVTFVNTVVAGVWLAVAYLKTRSLWFPLGVHWGWNWALGWFFGLPISGLHIVQNPLLTGEDLGPAWLTGGTYGIEGGVAGAVALIIFTLFTWRTRLVSPTPELLKLTSEENPVDSSRVSLLS
jgi:CAAX protease family protein